MKILITGGAGFIGSYLGIYLVQKKHDVVFLYNLSFGYLENLSSQNFSEQKLHFIKMDIRDAQVNRVLKDTDVVIHLAGISSLPECQRNPADAYAVNVSGTLNILEAARYNNVKRVIFSSTSAIYENEKVFPLRETTLCQPTLMYSLSKKHAEEVCRSYQKLYGMDIVILRFFNTYGPHMDFRRPNPPLISYIIQCLLNKETPILHSDGQQARDIIYVDDVIALCEMALTNKKVKNQIFNVGSGKTYTIQEIYNAVAKTFGLTDIKPIYRTSKLLWDKYPQLFEGEYSFQAKFLEKEVNKYTLASIAKAQKFLGWKPKVSLEEGLRKTIEFAMKNK